MNLTPAIYSLYYNDTLVYTTSSIAHMYQLIFKTKMKKQHSYKCTYEYFEDVFERKNKFIIPKKDDSPLIVRAEHYPIIEL